MEKFNDTNLERTLLSLKESPDQVWSNKVEQNLKNFTLSDQREYTNNIFYNFNFMKNKLIVASVLGLTLLIAVISALSVYLLNRSSSSSQLSESETIAILSKVLEKNAISTFQEGAGMARSADAAATTSSLTIAPIQDDFEGANYRYTKYTNNVGPAADRCSNGYIYDKFGGVSESFEYRPDGGLDYKSYMYKYVNYTLDGQLTNYSLNYTENNESITYDYAGGSFAVKNIYELGPENTDGIQPLVVNEDRSSSDAATTEAAPDSNQPSTTDQATLVAQYFGPDAQIVGSEQINGESHYILRYSYDYDCNDELTKIVYENTINQNTFAVGNTKTYVGSVDPSNLVSENIVTTETKNISSQEASQIFTFDQNVPVREVRYPYVSYEYSAEKEVEKTLEGLQANSIRVLFPVDSYALSYGYVTTPVTTISGSDYRSDRNFYPAGAIGDELYGLYNFNTTGTYLNALSYWNFTKTESITDYLMIETFAAGTTVAQITESKKLYLTEVTNELTENVQITIDGSATPATRYSFTAQQDLATVTRESEVSSDSRLIDPGTEMSNEPVNYSYIIVEFGGSVYVFNKDIYSGTEILASDLNLRSYNPNVAVDADFLKTELLKVYNPITIEPSTGGGSEPGDSGIACTMDAKECPDGSFVGRNPDLKCEFDPCP